MVGNPEGDPQQDDFFDVVEEADQGGGDQGSEPATDGGRTSRISPYPYEDSVRTRERDDSFARRWREGR
jgi:hypothetical protein